MSQPQVLGQEFNEGIGSGGFAVTISGNSFIFDPWTVTPEILLNKRKGTLGQSLAKQGIKVDADATATVQVPFDITQNPIWLTEGTNFTDPDGNNWWVLKATPHRKSGDVHKMDVECTLKLN